MSDFRGPRVMQDIDAAPETGAFIGKVSPYFAEQGYNHRHQPGNVRQVHSEQLYDSLRTSNPVFGFTFLFLRPVCLR